MVSHGVSFSYFLEKIKKNHPIGGSSAVDEAEASMVSEAVLDTTWIYQKSDRLSEAQENI